MTNLKFNSLIFSILLLIFGLILLAAPTDANTYTVKTVSDLETFSSRDFL